MVLKLIINALSNIQYDKYYDNGSDNKKSAENADIMKYDGNSLKAKNKALETLTTKSYRHNMKQKSHTADVFAAKIWMQKARL